MKYRCSLSLYFWPIFSVCNKFLSVFKLSKCHEKVTKKVDKSKNFRETSNFPPRFLNYKLQESTNHTKMIHIIHRRRFNHLNNDQASEQSNSNIHLSSRNDYVCSNLWFKQNMHVNKTRSRRVMPPNWIWMKLKFCLEIDSI